MELEPEYGNCKNQLFRISLSMLSSNSNPSLPHFCNNLFECYFSFGNLFSATERIGDPLVPYVNMKYTGSDEEVGPALSTMRARSSAERKNRNTDIFDGETM